MSVCVLYIQPRETKTHEAAPHPSLQEYQVLISKFHRFVHTNILYICRYGVKLFVDLE